MPLIKMGAAARRAGAGSTSTIRRALETAGIPLVTLSPGTFAVEESDLQRFLFNRDTEQAAGGPAAAKPSKSRKGKTPKKDGRR